MKIEEATLYWGIVYWTLFLCWIIGAGLNMYIVKEGFITNYRVVL